MEADAAHLSEPVLAHVQPAYPLLPQEFTVDAALQKIRATGAGEKIVYFYVVDADNRLIGVLPTRRLLMAQPGQLISELMISRVIAIPQTATLLDACELFVLHKFYAFPVVDADRRILGTVDVSLFTGEVLDITEPATTNDVFEAIGFRASRLRDASPGKAFHLRFPWLFATITSGTACALLAGQYEITLAKSLVLTFFLTSVLGINESVSIQSMTITIQALHATRPKLAWYLRALRREAASALLLGMAGGLLVGLIVWLWRSTPLVALVVGSSIALSVVLSCVLGLSIPSLLHALRLDPKIAAGPVTLAITDLGTLLIYFNIAALLL